VEIVEGGKSGRRAKNPPDTATHFDPAIGGTQGRRRHGDTGERFVGAREWKSWDTATRRRGDTGKEQCGSMGVRGYGGEGEERYLSM